MALQRITARVWVFLATAALAACSGGGGTGTSPTVPTTGTTHTGTSASPSPSPTPSATSSSAASSEAISGTVVDLPYRGTAAAPGYSVLPPAGAAAPTGSPIAAADVYVGPTIVSGVTAPVSVPAGFTHAKTGTDGTFAMTVAAATYAITIFAPSPHVAVLHQDLAVGSGTRATTFYLTVPTTLEADWYAQQTSDRAQFGAAPLVLDESELEAARYWSNFMQANAYFEHCIPASLCESGATTPPPASYGPQDVDPQHRFAYFHGFSGAAAGENIAAGYATWQSVDQAFMAEQSNCPGDTATNCAFTGNTGHFLNIIDPTYAWTGMATTTSSTGSPYYDEEFTLLESASPTSARIRSLRRDVPGLRR